jgi:hypothetical protein
VKLKWNEGREKLKPLILAETNEFAGAEGHWLKMGMSEKRKIWAIGKEKLTRAVR